METPTEIVNQTIEKTEDFLRHSFPDYISYGNGSFTISRGSTQIMLVVRPFNETDTCIECMATVVSGATLTEELLHYLLRKNAELHFGAFGLLFDGTIIFSHSITGANLDSNELTTSVHSVAIIADYYDDEIVKMAGGKRASDG
ncbi:MAG: YbjN domain-containing protein [Ignavibacteriae bacterium]|nr:YbjN domain-containing protein [Ignavibacteriota bacterium]